MSPPRNFAIVETVTEEQFFKKIGIYSRYLTQFINEGDVPKILDTIKDLEKLRQQAEAEKVE
ncbi:MAG TPA: hypothetical protein VGL11_05430 [Candidatus Binatia bacterium]